MPRKLGKRRQAARRARDPRKPRPQRTHRRRRAPRRARPAIVAIAPDGLSVAGGAPADQEAARDLFAKTGRGAHRGRRARRGAVAGGGSVVQRQDRRGGLLLWRRARAARGHRGGGRGLRGVFLRHGSCRPKTRAAQGAGAAATTPAPTSASMPASRNSARRSMRWACPTASTCIRARSTASTTTPAPRVTTKPAAKLAWSRTHGFFRYLSKNISNAGMRNGG